MIEVQQLQQQQCCLILYYVEFSFCCSNQFAVAVASRETGGIEPGTIQGAGNRRRPSTERAVPTHL